MIKETLLKDFANKSEFSDWFNREESVPPAKVIKKPNPRNVQNAARLAELEKELARYEFFEQYHSEHGLIAKQITSRKAIMGRTHLFSSRSTAAGAAHG